MDLSSLFSLCYQYVYLSVLSSNCFMSIYENIQFSAKIQKNNLEN